MYNCLGLVFIYFLVQMNCYVCVLFMFKENKKKYIILVPWGMKKYLFEFFLIPF